MSTLGLMVAISLLTPAASISQVRSCIPDSSQVQGVIRDADGAPLPGARVHLTAFFWDSNCRVGAWRYCETTTDSMGAYGMFVPLGTWGFFVKNPNHTLFPRNEGPGEIGVRAGENRADFQFEAHTIQGQVSGPSGAPLDEGLVEYDPYPHLGDTYLDNSGWSSARIENGVFAALVHGHGVFHFTVKPRPDAGGTPSIWRSIPVAADTSIELRLTGHEVRGVVSTREKGPMSGVMVIAFGPASARSLTDSDGRYRMWLPPGEYRWFLEPALPHIQRLSFPMDSVLGPLTRDFDLAYVAWSGVIKDGRTRKGLDSVDVYVSERGSTPACAWTTSGPGGRFRLLVQAGSSLVLRLRDRRGDSLRGRGDRLSRVPGAGEVEKPSWTLPAKVVRDSTFDLLHYPPED